MPISELQINDSASVSEAELLSSGSTIIGDSTPVGVTSILSGVLYCASEDFVNTRPLQSGNLVIIAGNSSAGTYQLGEVVDRQHVNIAGAADTTGGTAVFYHQSGENLVGVDTTRTHRLYTEAPTLTSVINNINAFLDSPHTGYLSVTRTGGQITQVDSWQDIEHTKRFFKVSVTRSTGQLATLVYSYYAKDGITVLGTETHTVARSSGLVSSIATTTSGFTTL